MVRMLGEPLSDEWIPDVWRFHGLFVLSICGDGLEQDHLNHVRDWDEFLQRGCQYGEPVRVLFAGADVVEFLTRVVEQDEDGDLFFRHTSGFHPKERCIPVVETARLPRSWAWLMEPDTARVRAIWKDRVSVSA